MQTNERNFSTEKVIWQKSKENVDHFYQKLDISVI